PGGGRQIAGLDPRTEVPARRPAPRGRPRGESRQCAQPVLFGAVISRRRTPREGAFLLQEARRHAWLGGRGVHGPARGRSSLGPPRAAGGSRLAGTAQRLQPETPPRGAAPRAGPVFSATPVLRDGALVRPGGRPHPTPDRFAVRQRERLHVA